MGIGMRMRGDRERGASLVEFAFVAPFLILLLFGIIEFAWLFGQDLTIKHGAREGARLAAVAFGANTTALTAETISRMNVTTGSPTVTFCVKDWLVAPAGMDPGDGIEVTVAQTTNSLTGMMDWIFPPSLSSVVEIRAEQTPAGYWTGANVCAP
jgi:Flp pilus assembly protein TadG